MAEPPLRCDRIAFQHRHLGDQLDSYPHKEIPAYGVHAWHFVEKFLRQTVMK